MRGVYDAALGINPFSTISLRKPLTRSNSSCWQ
uniref:Uncharacterized protein n=1 Tax=Arundo donax TaxID=35708 RepID=A0A0A9FT58_ARUDO